MTSEFPLLWAFGIFKLGRSPLVACRGGGGGTKILSGFLLSGKQSLHLRCKFCLEFLHFETDNILHMSLRKVAQLLIIHVLYRFQNGDRVVLSGTNSGLVILLG
jgi:hypothetical protein